jgi:hypothetical protein
MVVKPEIILKEKIMRGKLSRVLVAFALPLTLFALEMRSFSPIIDATVADQGIDSPVLLLSAADQKTETGTPPPEKKAMPCDFPHRIQIGGNYTYAWITPKGNNTTRGSLGGAQGIYEYRPYGGVYAGAAFSYRIGDTTHSVGSREIQDFNTQGRIGYTLPKMDKFGRFALYTGFGGRYMPEEVKLGSASLDFRYTTFYVPVGLAYERRLTNHFSIGCNFQWLPQVFPMVRIVPLDGAQWDLKDQLGNFFVEVPFMITSCSGKYAVTLNPFFEIWRDGRSTAKTLTGLKLDLPRNKYIFTGINVNFAFSF